LKPRPVAALLAVLILVNCKYVPPPDYVPDERIVYLKQKVELGPIPYAPALAHPYTWELEKNISIDAVRPRFLSWTTLPSYMNPSYRDDAILYREVTAHFEYLRTEPEFLKLRKLLDEYPYVTPPRRPFAKGAKIRDFQNAVEYAYPESADSTITVFNNGEFKINFPDGRTYHEKKKENYYFEDLNGKNLFSVFPGQDQFRRLTNGYKFGKFGNKEKRVTSGPRSVSKFERPLPQYVYRTGQGRDYALFLNSEGQIEEVSLRFQSGLHISISHPNRSILVAMGTKAVTLRVSLFNPSFS